ncbi:BEN domain-containing protein 5-like isoform X4 [Stegostoma tigrinum]|nr:BEN domain-containing protein 5-like isoform X4 [Stegostoma tigrinum]XP_048398037.1 BEN domain-containing protein 5-like isoform X4 [Stegostoma tigrinum]XP_048398039.1 BEN domain-containing protein 5-like isoform X4 [Stegostoma tigrinum]XP_048398040.1 BEN domain-containing protein 5-like isoform X4 [Stegostoma tigrinum]
MAAVAKYAYVRFLDDNGVSRIVSIQEDIKKFKLLTHNPSKVYMVRWIQASIGKSEDYDSGEYTRSPNDPYCKAQIMLLAGKCDYPLQQLCLTMKPLIIILVVPPPESPEEIRAETAKRRLLMCPTWDSNVEWESADDRPGPSRNTQGKRALEATSVTMKDKRARTESAWRKHLQRLMDGFKTEMPDCALGGMTDSLSVSGAFVNEMAPPSRMVEHDWQERRPGLVQVEAENKVLRQKVESLNSDLQEATRIIRRLQERMDQLQDLNCRLQEQLLSRAQSRRPALSRRAVDLTRPVPPTSVQMRTEPSPTSTGSHGETNPSADNLYTPIDGMVQLQGGLQVTERQWENVLRSKTNSMFVKTLAAAVWGSDVLRNRSIHGRVCARFINADTPPVPKPALSPVKLSAVKDAAGPAMLFQQFLFLKLRECLGLAELNSDHSVRFCLIHAGNQKHSYSSKSKILQMLLLRPLPQI